MRALGGFLRRFTVAEILIVLVVLGVLAAVLVPQFTVAGQNSREDILLGTLQNVRAQVQLYRMQHGDAIPDLAGNWSPLTQSDSFGNPPQSFGPYMQAAPVNPFNGLSNVMDGTVAAPAKSACGFIYDYNAGHGSGQIYATDTDGRRIAGTGTFGRDGFLAY